MDPNMQEGMREIAKMGLSLLRGLYDDGANDKEAQIVLTSVMTGFFMSAHAAPDTQSN